VVVVVVLAEMGATPASELPPLDAARAMPAMTAAPIPTYSKVLLPEQGSFNAANVARNEHHLENVASGDSQTCGHFAFSDNGSF
jgi:hypothetical protein